jgi:nicotinamide mononucleotide (NMN) deamidase PncC
MAITQTLSLSSAFKKYSDKACSLSWVFVEEFNFGQPREKVIDRAVNKAFEMLYKEISKN